MGYLFRGSASSAPPVAAEQQKEQVSSETNQTQAGLQQSAAPLLEALNRNPADYDMLVKLGDIY